jgi:hypothetical protein
MKFRKLLIALGLFASVSLALWAACPTGTTRCDYHNAYANWDGYEWKNGKQFSKFKHSYTDDKGKQRECILIVECN